MVFEEAALFAFGKAELTPAGQESIRKYREEARAELSAASLVKITGHTDNVGPAEYNQQLSLRRAQAVRDYLVKLGGNPSIMEVAGWVRPSRSPITRQPRAAQGIAASRSKPSALQASGNARRYC
jgi:OOP family OmpA-OmpF porin